MHSPLPALTFSLLSLLAAQPPVAYAAEKAMEGLEKMFPSGLHDLMDPNGLNNLPRPEYALAKWKPGMIPTTCMTGSQKDKYCPADGYDVYDISYADCRQPWTVCRCQDSPMTIENIADGLGRLPVGVREYVRFTRFYSTEVGGGAYTDGQDITFFGNATNSQSVFMHESSHNLDRWVAGGSSGWYSATPEWKEVISRDSCVPDSYSASSWAEDFAQVGVMVGYDANVKSVWTLDDTSGCLFQQFQTVTKFVYDNWRYDASKKCSSRHKEDDSPPVCISDEAKSAGRCERVEYEDDNQEERNSGVYPAQTYGITTRSDYIAPENQAAHDVIVAELKKHSLLSELHVHGHGSRAVRRAASNRNGYEIATLADTLSPENQAVSDAIVAEMKAHGRISRRGRVTGRYFY